MVRIFMNQTLVNVMSFSKHAKRRVLFSMQQQISNALFDV
jgi:hypothetical protein